MTHTRRRFLLAGGAGLAGAAVGFARPAAAATWETVISDSFTDYATLEANWNYLYPWGSDHNGTARMYGSASDHNHISLDGGTLTLRATRINWDEGNSSADPHLPIRYHSGAVHARQHVVVSDQFPQWEVKGRFQAPSASGTWPAFWLTGVNSWPPESDILEFKGDARNWFNTYKNAEGGWSNTIVNVSSPGSWHGYRAWINKVNATDVDIHYYLDDTWVGQHRGANFVNQPLWIIINLQMEGSSGSSGPTTDTLYHARDIYVGRSRA
ncbi:family 16 glycosylhydrolase [Streptomyces sp. 3MP-14]|uniref:Family 16 glycosylhydrolase n=1 Tax=Streptomyces mimosae TaxID=2586635 RepID=A0A5N5ZX17_9ACTN|nr:MULTISPECIES: family 16 glycosylhydrolase [Streptomyces]KAB8160309.1 family 16 glycosylhydrolase [Streptomyces mimosae]KAB8172929.1 family 16 glycosylhydrolase [Streptomyces sp. 3MP-14]